jgi:isopenicillin-N N-acyltransferase like protein
MKAIANAANVSFEDILVLNCRSEFSLAGAVCDGCSAIAYKNPETGKQLLAQNWDWHPNQLDNVIILDITNIDGSRIVTITEAGIVGKVGFNGDCVGVTLNGIKTTQVSLNFDMLPIHIALRYVVLESPSASEAINQVMRIGIASTAHFLIADSVSAYGVEVSPIGNGVIPADQDGFVLHTNHWQTEPQIVDSAHWLPDTIHRLNRMEALKPQVKTSEDVWAVLGDEDGASGCICRKAPGVDVNAELETLFGVVMDLEVGAAEFVHGRPTKFNQRILLPKTGPLGNVGSDVKRQSMI